jgi:hypothetical protein
MRSEPVNSRLPWALNAAGTLLAAVLAYGCGGTGEAPAAGDFAGFIPDLRGERVMVFPVQIGGGVPGDADPEIEFALRSRTEAVEWIFPDELESALARSPAVDSSVRGLPVGFFLRAEVERIGDPLFGQLLRMGALANSEIALIPVTVRAGAEGVDGESVVEIVATILDVRSGRVIWFGVVSGRPGSVADFGSLASAVESFAATLLWYVQ